MLKIAFNRFHSEGGAGGAGAAGAAAAGSPVAGAGSPAAGSAAPGGAQAQAPAQQAPKAWNAGQYARSRFQLGKPPSEPNYYEGITGQMTAEHHNTIRQREQAHREQLASVEANNKLIQELYGYAENGFDFGNGEILHFQDQADFDNFVEAATKPQSLMGAARNHMFDRLMAARLEKAQADAAKNAGKPQQQARVDGVNKVPVDKAVANKPSGKGSLSDIFANLGGDPTKPPPI